MRKFMGVLALGGMLLGSSIVSAEEITGVIESIGEGDQGPTLTIDGDQFVAEATAVDSLSELKAGDTVRAVYSEGSGTNFVSMIEKVE